jgi:hypothetical protein
MIKSREINDPFDLSAKLIIEFDSVRSIVSYFPLGKHRAALMHAVGEMS